MSGRRHFGGYLFSLQPCLAQTGNSFGSLAFVIALAIIGLGTAFVLVKKPRKGLAIWLVVCLAASVSIFTNPRPANAATTADVCAEQIVTSSTSEDELSDEELSLIIWELIAAILEFIVAEYEIFATADDGQTWAQVATVEPEQSSFQTSTLNLPEDTQFIVKAVSETGDSTFVVPEGQSAYVPDPSMAEQLLVAARAQLGEQQDATALVERSLRTIGYNVGDIGPMGFAQFGFRVNPADVQAGDIMIRGGHVAIYSGDGMAIHGGFGGSTVETGYDANPNGYAIIVRIL